MLVWLGSCIQNRNSVHGTTCHDIIRLRLRQIFFAGVFLQLSATEHDRPTADMYVHPIALKAVQPSCCIAAAWLKYDGRTPNSFQSHQAIMTYQIVHGLIAIQVPASLYLIPNTRSNTGHGLKFPSGSIDAYKYYIVSFLHDVEQSIPTDVVLCPSIATLKSHPWRTSQVKSCQV